MVISWREPDAVNNNLKGKRLSTLKFFNCACIARSRNCTGRKLRSIDNAPSSRNSSTFMRIVESGQTPADELLARYHDAWGGDVRYYVRPLGSVINIAPVVGYRHLETTRYSVDGVHVGLRLLLVPSRTGAADLAFTQSWVAPGDANEVSLTTLSFGYALTHNLRLSTDLQKQNSRFRSDSRVGIGLEWMF